MTAFASAGVAARVSSTLAAPEGVVFEVASSLSEHPAVAKTANVNAAEIRTFTKLNLQPEHHDSVSPQTIQSLARVFRNVARALCRVSWSLVDDAG